MPTLFVVGQWDWRPGKLPDTLNLSVLSDRPTVFVKTAVLKVLVVHDLLPLILFRIHK